MKHFLQLINIVCVTHGRIGVIYLRKKSHISLAKFLDRSVQAHNLHKHRRAFYIGSILPDCTPSFFTRRHTIADSYEKLQDEIRKLTEDYKKKRLGTYFFRHLGIVTHYLADYCTYPHNESFDGGFRDHCSYEKELKFALRSYCKSGADSDKEGFTAFDAVDSLDDLFELIELIHKHYRDEDNEVEVDCQFSVILCQAVVNSILLMSSQRNLTYVGAMA